MKMLMGVFLLLLFCTMGIAQEVVQPALSTDDFLAQVLQAVHSFGGLSTVGKIALVITLIIASMKVSILRQLIWSKLSPAQAWLAPALGLIAGLFDVANTGTVTAASVLAYVASGAGAIILHELLDSLKQIPIIKEKYLGAIDFFMNLLKAKK